MAESNRQRRLFPDAFKLEAVAAVRGGRSVSAVAAELGLPDRLVRTWLRWAEGRTAARGRALGPASQAAKGPGGARGQGAARWRRLPRSQRRRRAAWARAPRTRRRRSGGCGVSSIGFGWSATFWEKRRSSSARRRAGGELCLHSQPRRRLSGPGHVRGAGREPEWLLRLGQPAGKHAGGRGSRGGGRDPHRARG